MNKNKTPIDSHFISQKSVEISFLILEIKNAFPNGNDHILRNLAAASIHMTLFMNDVLEIVKDEKGVVSNNTKTSVDSFLNECGCNFNDK